MAQEWPLRNEPHPRRRDGLLRARRCHCCRVCLDIGATTHSLVPLLVCACPDWLGPALLACCLAQFNEARLSCCGSKTPTAAKTASAGSLLEKGKKRRRKKGKKGNKGVGGAGGNIINSMKESGVEGVEFLNVNTDSQQLKHSKVEKTLQLGPSCTKGLGAGADPEMGKKSADEVARRGENARPNRSSLKGCDAS